MSHVNSDLEEGEILDDSPPSPTVSDKKNKELPRRYVVRENKSSIHKHKKDCKYAIRYHAKKLSKLKKTPNKGKVAYKKHHKSTCLYEKSHKVPDRYSSSGVSKHLLSKNGHSFSQHSLISEMQSSFKGKLIINKQGTKFNKSKSKNLVSNEQTVRNVKNDLCISETQNLKNDFRNSTDKSNTENSLSNSAQKDDHLSNALLQEKNLKADNVKNAENLLLSSSTEPKNEESEDEEELRRIALATFLKRKTVVESSESQGQNVEIVQNAPVPESSDVNYVQISHIETNNVASDNYEVVDMEVDEDVQDLIGIIQTSEKSQNLECSENLFVIDTNPSLDFQGNKENSCLEPQTANNSTDEEFEADILRAELIDKMYRKKNLQDEEAEKCDITSHKKQLPILPEKNSFVNYQKPKVNFHRKSLQSSKHILRKTSLNKPRNLKRNISKITLPPQANKPSERLIIALNEESSSDDSDNTEEVRSSSVTENPVESIVALISDCRQKSESGEKTQETVEHVPKAVSCLSKAQQQEYNSLMKILAEKQKVSTAQDTHPQKNGSIHSPLDDLKKLEGKLAGLKDALKNKKVSVTSLSKEINSKKVLYMKAKLSAQHLKEQYIAAEKIRKAKLIEWSKACDHLKLVKESVSDLENKINKVQTLCAKISPSVQGQSYNLPLVPSGNEQS